MFIKKARQLGLSLAEAGWVLDLRAQNQRPCRHVIALLDRKLAEIDSAILGLTAFRSEINRLREISARELEAADDADAVCSIIERGIHHEGEVALGWLEGRNLSAGSGG